MSRVWIWPLVAIAGCSDKADSQADAQPAFAQLRVSWGVGSQFSIVQVEGVQLQLQDCEGGEAEVEAPLELDLLADQIEIPAGEWCGLSMDFEGPLSMQAETDDLAVFELRLDMSSLEFVASEPWWVDGQHLVLELGQPDWVHPPSLGIEPSSTFLLDSSHPQHDVIRRSLESWSSLRLDDDADSWIGEWERDSDPVMIGAAELPGSRFVVMAEDGGTWVSADTESWVFEQVHGEPIRDSATSHGLVLAVGGQKRGRISSSLEGASWMDVEDSGGALTGVASSGRIAVVVGLDGRISSSADLLTWTEIVDGSKDYLVEEDFYAVSRGETGFIAVGEDGIKAWSTDGSTWTTEEGTIALYDVAWGEEFFVAVGEGGARKQANAAGDWTTPVFGGADLTGVAYGDGRWVAVGPGRSLISDDGASWEIFPQEFDLERVAFGLDHFLAIGDGRIYSSPDGFRWTERDLSSEADLSGIRFLP